MFVYKHLRNALHSAYFQNVNKYPGSTWFGSGESERESVTYLAMSSCLPVQRDTLLSSAVLLKYQILALALSLLPLGAQKTCLGWGMEQHSKALEGQCKPKICVTISTALY